ncbi:MAG: nucleotidyl transferase AbiEii/AbiGii toxin family protein [Acidimicrobiales bacterium]
MSPLVLPGGNRHFVEALGRIADTTGTWSVIGGFAVWCHLGGSHRPTLDIDTAAAASAHETLVALGAPGGDEHRRIVEGVKLEIIEVLDPSPGAVDLDPKDRLFVTSHWSAARLTVDVQVQCEGLDVTVPVARRLPLVACKLHAWLDRRDQRADKRGSDGLDIVRLLGTTTDWDALAADFHQIDGLRDVVAWGANEVLIEQAARVSRLIGLHTDVRPPPPDEVEVLGRLLVDLV